MKAEGGGQCNIKHHRHGLFLALLPDANRPMANPPPPPLPPPAPPRPALGAFVPAAFVADPVGVDVLDGDKIEEVAPPPPPPPLLAIEPWFAEVFTLL